VISGTHHLTAKPHCKKDCFKFKFWINGILSDLMYLCMSDGNKEFSLGKGGQRTGAEEEGLERGASGDGGAERPRVGVLTPAPMSWGANKRVQRTTGTEEREQREKPAESENEYAELGQALSPIGDRNRTAKLTNFLWESGK